MRGEKDRSSKWLLQTFGDVILRGLAGVRERIESWRALPTEVLQPKQIPDGLLEVLFTGQTQPDLFLIEIATYPEKRVSEQMMRDAALTYLDQKKLPEAVTLVLAKYGRAKVAGKAVVESRLRWSKWSLTWHVVNLWDLPADELLGMNEVGLVPWVPLTKFSEPKETILRECRKRIDEQAKPDLRGNMLAVAQVLGRLRYDFPTLKAFFGEDQGMIESPFYQDLLDDPEFIKRSRVHQRLLAEKEAEKLLLLEKERQLLLDILTDRFQSVTADLEASIRQISDAETLATLIRWAAGCPSLDAFRSRMPT